MTKLRYRLTPNHQAGLSKSAQPLTFTLRPCNRAHPVAFKKHFMKRAIALKQPARCKSQKRQRPERVAAFGVR